MIFLLRNQLFGDICILNEGSALLPFSLSILTVQEPIITRGGKAACSFLYDIIREVRIEKEFSCMEAKKYQAFWRGAIILTIASFVTKVLSAFTVFHIKI